MDAQNEHLEFDVLIVGAGPAGLCAAIRLAQLNQQHGKNLSICIIEKAASIGAHTLSGAILDPIALTELLPDWQNSDCPVNIPVTKEHFYLLSANSKFKLPTFRSLHNKGNYIISLGKLCQWLANQAEQLGVNVFPGFAAHEVLFDQDKVVGTNTGPMGLNADGSKSARYQPGISIYAKQTLFAEGCRGSLSEKLIHKYELRKQCDPQSYGIGIKELWRIPAPQHQLGTIIHTVGWPLDRATYGGGFIYHYENNLIAIGHIVGLDYQNPYLDPFKVMQNYKTHPMIRKLLADGECIAYGARALNEGGWQNIPKLTFPGGMLLGCSAGFMNVAKIKGNHTAMKSGILAAEAIFTSQTLQHTELKQYEIELHSSWVSKELYKVRNVRPGFHYGLWPGLLLAGIDQSIFAGRAPWTMHFTPDYQALKPAKDFQPIHYPKPDGKLTFDKLTQVYLTGTHHREDEPCHLLLKDSDTPTNINLPTYAGPEQYYCPAGVYEYVDNENGVGKRLQINAANCIHCKTCDIKDPTQNIIWSTPEGGDGPKYSNL